MKFAVIYIILIGLTVGCGGDQARNKSRPEAKEKTQPPEQQSESPQLGFELVRTLPHRGATFTQGLCFHNGYLYETTGLRGKSKLKKIDPANGEIVRQADIPAPYFAEGMTIYKDKIYVLTWTSGECLVFDPETFRLEKTYEYPGEGWGLDAIGDRMIMSDGTNTLKFVDPEGFAIIETLPVYSKYRAVGLLNELEVVDGTIYANVWQQDAIVGINPETGEVISRLDLRELREYLTITNRTEVLNGIAYNAESKEFFVTGKYWNLIFLLKIK
jgi:glutamine cyclotransferase